MTVVIEEVIEREVVLWGDVEPVPLREELEPIVTPDSALPQAFETHVPRPIRVYPNVEPFDLPVLTKEDLARLQKPVLDGPMTMALIVGLAVLAIQGLVFWSLYGFTLYASFYK